ncbi:hypothetical protein Lal_00029074 [Lupinus albus]|nr:hypothetical protein Lal_00029074 [Lupinus albus]
MINTQFIRPETGHPRKSQLQNYARRSNPDPSIFSSKTEAEQSVAEVPLMSLSIDISEKAICILFIQGECSSSFKNKLQELTQRKCFGKPTYKTTQSGYPNMPTFFSTVEVESMEFHGKAAKSKKEAQQNAANVAYLALKEYELKEVELKEITYANVKLSSNEQYYNVYKSSSSYLLCNRFKVYTCFSNITEAFSEGITVMPIADNNWVAVSLEFPNEGL